LKGEKHFVFVQNRPGEFTRQEVAIGSEQDGRVLILSGLQAGQQVVTDGCILSATAAWNEITEFF
jgi:multidrug efflux pump subunit AcrA (membrane-fusion protein)